MKKILFALLAAACAFSASAQEKGYLTGSLESNDYVYQDDVKSGALAGDDKFGSNNYLKLDYNKGRLSAGMQLEGYFPTTIGYPMAQNKLSLSNLYVSWTDNDYSVTAGTFYEQLGSGLLFRSWEDRALGLNSALVGARGTYTYNDMLAVRAFAGVPRLDKILNPMDRKFFGLGLSKTLVAAGDVAFSLSDSTERRW